jgi:hypothetical protein
LNSLSLSISDAPVCISSTITIVGASIDESVSIPCRISADPPRVSFEWTFSNSGERYEVPSGHHTTIQQSYNADPDHIYLDADESGTNGNGNGTLTFFALLLKLPFFSFHHHHHRFFSLSSLRHSTPLSLLTLTLIHKP